MSSTPSELGHILDYVRKLDAATRKLLIQQIQSIDADFNGESEASDAESWTKEELANLINPTPMTGKEIAEAGLLGGWEDMGIEDSVNWVNQQKAKRRRKYQW